MIEVYDQTMILPGLANHPTLLLVARIAVECGCAAYLGVREDTGEPATTCAPCCEDHRPHIIRFNDNLKATYEPDVIEQYRDRPLGAVIEEVLIETYKDVTA